MGRKGVPRELRQGASAPAHEEAETVPDRVAPSVSDKAAPPVTPVAASAPPEPTPPEPADEPPQRILVADEEVVLDALGY